MSSHYQIIRRPSAAGQFYPSDKDELSIMIDHFFKNIIKPSVLISSPTPKIIIVPHAGYVFSGQTAACAFQKLSGQNYDTIFILGPSHNFLLDGLILYGGDLVETPLGQIPVNKKIIQNLLNNPYITINNSPHNLEHSLEVEIPFLQKILKNNWRVVLGLINDDDPILLRSIAATLSSIINSNNNLIVISSDLSHYPNYKNAQYSDQKILSAIIAKNVDLFDLTEKEIINQKLSGLETCACGSTIVKLAMLVANNLNFEGQIIHYNNSGDIVCGNKEHVVGYGAVIFYATEKYSPDQAANISSTNNIYLKTEEQQAALKLVRNTLELSLGLTTDKYTSYRNFSIFSEKMGVFVTLHNKGVLRGCIGLIEPILPLDKSLIEMAKSAAFHDPRFLPLTKDELEKIKIEISLLTPPVAIKNIEKIIPGQHGVIIRKNGYSGIFLPQVWQETGWNKETFLNHLCTDKAGLELFCWQKTQTSIYIFEVLAIEENI